LLALGLAAGMALNSIREPAREGTMTWEDPVVLASFLLFFWFASVSLIKLFYRPAREGHKVAYMTLASFVFLALVLSLVLLGQHGISSSRPEPQAWGNSPDNARRTNDVHGQRGGP
jgi:hypothetical protein